MSHYSTDRKFYNPDNAETIILLKARGGRGSRRFPFFYIQVSVYYLMLKIQAIKYV